jgi:hypothetical protein
LQKFENAKYFEYSNLRNCPQVGAVRLNFGYDLQASGLIRSRSKDLIKSKYSMGCKNSKIQLFLNIQIFVTAHELEQYS